MDRYSFSFVTHKGLPVTVNIYDTESTTSKRTTLTPSANPLTITMQSSDNPMEPVRYTSAKINVLCKPGEVLELTNNLRYFVQIVQDDDNNIFTGFLRAEAYTQGYSSIEETFTYNAVDFLGASEGIKLNEETLSFADVIRHMAKTLTDVHDVSSLLYVGDSLPRKDAASVITTLNLKTRAENWRQEDEDKRVQTYASVLDFIREWCTFFGMTAFCNGEDLYIGSADDTGRHNIGMLTNLATGTPLADTFSPMGAMSFAYLTPTGQHTIDYKQPAQKVEMTFGGDSYDSSALPVLDAESRETRFYHQWWASDRRAVSPVTRNGFPWFVLYTDNVPDSGIVVRRMKIRNGRYEPTDAYPPYFYPNMDNFDRGCAGAALIRTDYWNTGTPDEGQGEGVRPWNYDFKDVLYIWGKDFSATEGNELEIEDGRPFSTYDEASADTRNRLAALTPYYVVRMQSSGPVAFSKGGLCFSMNDVAGENRMPLRVETFQDKNHRRKMLCSLSIGNKYWDGKQWSGPEAKFYITLGKGERSAYHNNGGFEVINTKSLDQLYTCTGYSIPIDGYMTGQLDFRIYCVVEEVINANQNPDAQLSWYVATVYSHELYQITDLRIEYCNAIDYTITKQKDPTRRLYETNTGGMGEVSAQTTLSSGEQVAENFGIVEGTTKMTNVPTALTGSAETLTFDRMKRLNFAPAKRVTISANGDIPIPATLYAHQGETYRIESATDWNVIEDTVKLKLIKTQ